MKFDGTRRYVATDDLKIAVNAAITLSRPLLIKGEPGTGKTALALEVAEALGVPHHRVAYQIDDQGPPGPLRVRRRLAPARQPAGRRARPRHQELHQARQAVGRVRHGRAPGAADRRDRQGRHRVPQRPVAGARSHGVLRLRDGRDGEGGEPRPIVIITSNNEKELPDAFLRRCFFHYIKFPDDETMRQIVEVHFPGLKGRLVVGGACASSTRSATCRA